jgi:hypothetical protein
MLDDIVYGIKVSAKAEKMNLGSWCNGSTSVSRTLCLGSNPSDHTYENLLW